MGIDELVDGIHPQSKVILNALLRDVLLDDHTALDTEEEEDDDADTEVLEEVDS